MVSESGFIHVVEAVLVSVIAVSMLVLVFQPVRITEDWERAGLKNTGEDILSSLEKNGTLEDIMEYNRTEIQNIFQEILGGKRSIQYNLRTENAYKNKIRVGYNCTGCDVKSERREIQKILKPPILNGRMITFNVFPFNWRNLSSYRIDVVFLNGDGQLSLAKSYNSTLKRFLSRGGGAVEYVDLENNEIDDFQENIFGLETGSGSGEELNFSNRNDVSKLNYDPSKVFYGVASVANTSGGEGWWRIRGKKFKVEVVEDGDSYNVTVNETICVDCKAGDTFNISEYNFTIEEAGTVEGGVYRGDVLVWFRHHPGYDFTNFVDGSEGDISGGDTKAVLETKDGNEAGYVINSSRGRAAWVSRGGGDDVKGLVTSAVVWGAGEGWWNFLRSPGEDSVTVSHFVSKNGEIYKTYKVVLTLWSIY